MVFVVKRKVKKSSMDKTLKVILHNVLHKGYSGDLSLSRLPFNVVVILQCYIPLYYLKNVFSTKFWSFQPPLYHTVLCIMVVYGFLHNNITQKPASHFLYNSLAVLVRHSQAQNVFRLTLSPSNTLLWNFKISRAETNITNIRIRIDYILTNQFFKNKYIRYDRYTLIEQSLLEYTLI